MSFTVIGDTVNTASRLQGLTRTLETPLVVGDPLVNAVRAATPDAATIRLLDRLHDRGEQALRGRSDPVRIWTRGDAPDRRSTEEQTVAPARHRKLEIAPSAERVQVAAGNGTRAERC
jgi:class 3 adenylate cyclase